MAGSCHAVEVRHGRRDGLERGDVPGCAESGRDADDAGLVLDRLDVLPAYRGAVQADLRGAAPGDDRRSDDDHRIGDGGERCAEPGRCAHTTEHRFGRQSEHRCVRHQTVIHAEGGIRVHVLHQAAVQPGHQLLAADESFGNGLAAEEHAVDSIGRVEHPGSFRHADGEYRRPSTTHVLCGTFGTESPYRWTPWGTFGTESP